MRLSKFLWKRAKLSVVLITLIGVAVIVVPANMFTSTAVKNVSLAVTSIEEGSLTAPPPDISVRDWPFVGKKPLRSGRKRLKVSTKPLLDSSHSLRRWRPFCLCLQRILISL